jgi:hypothetical protein
MFTLQGHDRAYGVPLATHLAPMLRGWMRQGTRHAFGGSSASLARGLGLKNTSAYLVRLVWLGVRNGSTIDTILRPPKY